MMELDLNAIKLNGNLWKDAFRRAITAGLCTFYFVVKTYYIVNQ